jgi:copper chaperone CopZ
VETKTVTVPNIGCDGCVKSIKSEVADIAGVTQVDGVVDTKQITVQWTAPATWDIIKAKMAEIEYAPEA